MEREENTIYHSEKLHMAQKQPCYSSITADFICLGAQVMALPPQLGGCTNYKQSFKLLSFLLTYFNLF